MADDSLQSRWDACRPLLLIHRRGPLSSSARSCLSVQILWLVVLSRLLRLHHAHLLPVWRSSLRWIGWRSTSVVRTVQVVVVVHVRLSVRSLCGVLVHLHVSICRTLCCLSLLCRDDLLLLLLPLSAQSFKSLLLLYTWRWRSART